MGVGTSLGAYYDDEFHYSSAKWDDKYDDNIITPSKSRTDAELSNAELDPTTGTGLEVSMGQMPFPDNRNPDSDFTSRFGNLPPSGILNDIKRGIPEKPLQRRS